MNFEAEALWGKAPHFGLDDEGNTNAIENSYWYLEDVSATNCDSVIDRYEDKFSVYDGFDETANPQPSYMLARGYNKACLNVGVATGALLRTFNPVQTGEGALCNAVAVKSTVYFDALMKFGAYETQQSADDLAARGEKISCHFALAPGDDEVTNFVISAGYVTDAGRAGVRNYVTTYTGDPNGWHRLTVRLVADAATGGSVKYPAFAVYLDGALVTCDPAEYPLADAAASVFGGNAFFEQGALFPSMQKDTALAVRALSLSGEGAVDELALTETNPFPLPSQTAEVYLTCDDAAFAKLSAVVTSADGTVTTNELERPFGGRTFAVRPAETLQFLAEMAPTFVLGQNTVKISGNTSIVASSRRTLVLQFVEGDLTGRFADGSRLVARLVTAQNFFRVGKTAYSSFMRAIAAATHTADHLVTLDTNVVLSVANGSSDANGQAWIYPGNEAVLDLCGHAITGTNYRVEATIYNQGTFTVIDSVGGGEIVAPGTAIATIRDNAAADVNHERADLTLGSLDSQMFTVKGRVTCTSGSLVLRTGTYLTPGDEPADPFYLARYVDTDPRFSVEAAGPSADGAYWSVFYNGKRLVRLATPHGAVTPTNVVLVADATSVTNGNAIAVDAPGYTLTGWRDAATDEPWDLATPVVSDTNLVAALSLDTYAVSYDAKGGTAVTAPASYTVEDDETALATPEKVNFDFAGWRDAATERFVASVGSNATFVGTGTVVTGDLELVAQWTPQRLVWTNADRVEGVESNGWYWGSWQMALNRACAADQKIALDEIAFSIVNPTQYPKTAERLALVLSDAQTVYSDVRAWETQANEYVVGTNVLENGRARVAYRFSDVRLEPNAAYEVFFVSGTGGTSVTGFVRLAYCPDGDANATFGNCDAAKAPEAAYADFCPVYEVRGHAVEVTP